MEPSEPELFKGWDPARFAAIAKPVAAPPREKIVILGHELGEKSYLFAFAAAFLIGIIFNVMPCVLPVVPLKAIGFYEVSQHNRALSLAFGAVFSLGLVLTFAVLGLFVVVLRWLNWGELFANPWFLAGRSFYLWHAHVGSICKSCILCNATHRASGIRAHFPGAHSKPTLCGCGPHVR